jgi:mannan endo-1,4-beta-mannosidase
MVSRYASNPAIMAWELANEPRCAGTVGRNLNSSDTCSPATIDAWIDEMSSYIKSIDPHHLVTWGGEGQFNRPSVNDSFYNGSSGTDFDHELTLLNIDFGTFHTYPDWWNKTLAWTDTWIRDHAASGRAANKPVVHEEYGWLTSEARFENLGYIDNTSRVDVESRWQAIALEEKLAGDIYWQFGYSNYSYGRNNDDGFTIFLDKPEAQPLVYEHAADVNGFDSAQ